MRTPKGLGSGAVAQVPVHKVRPDRILVVEGKPLGFETLDLLSGPRIQLDIHRLKLQGKLTNCGL